MRPADHFLAASSTVSDDMEAACLKKQTGSNNAASRRQSFGDGAVELPVGWEPVIEFPDAVHHAIANSLAPNTRRAYASDISQYKLAGRNIPATPVEIASYIADISCTHAAATIARKIASLSKAHRAFGYADPCKTEVVKSTLRGIRRTIGIAQREAKPLLKEDLFAILERMGNRPKDVRDKALLLIGFAGAFRRSELVGLNVDDIEHVRQGIVIHLRHSKTDQEGKGRKIGIPFGRTRWCPVAHLWSWMELSAMSEGPVFRGIDKGGTINSERLSSDAISLILRGRAKLAGFSPEGYSGHSLRAGLATSAAMAGVSTWKIRQQTGHASDAMLQRYVRNGDLFNENACGFLL